MAKKKKKDLQQEVIESAHRIWLAGLGAVATAEEEGSKAFKKLVEKGETFESRGKKQFDKVIGRIDEARTKAGSRIEKLGESFDDKVSDTLKRLGVPSRDEIQRLTKRVEELTRKVDQLKPKPAKASKQSA